MGAVNQFKGVGTPLHCWGMKPHVRVAALALSTMLAGGALVGCSAAGDGLEEPAMTTVAAADEGASTQSSSAQPSSKEKPEPEKKCASLAKDPREQYPTGNERLGRMPAVVGSGDLHVNFWIGGVENNYDPCAELSWITFAGGRGYEDGPAGTGASITDGLALYINGEPVGEMREFDRIENIQRLSPSSAEFSWGEVRNGTAAGVTHRFTVTLKNDGGKLVVEGPDAQAFYDQWDRDTGQYLLGHDG